MPSISAANTVHSARPVNRTSGPVLIVAWLLLGPARADQTRDVLSRTREPESQRPTLTLHTS